MKPLHIVTAFSLVRLRDLFHIAWWRGLCPFARMMAVNRRSDNSKNILLSPREGELKRAVVGEPVNPYS